jgi:N-hydroxyarylamine O-acetyltransferase
MDVDAYLERIGYVGSREPTAETLRHLHRSHMRAVPFENIDIQLGRRIVLSLDSIFDKIVHQRRGGFCYELNGLFGWLLERLGFAVTLLSARVCDGGRPGPEFDHLTLLVGLERRVIADVGFGDSFLEPLSLEDRGVAVHQGSEYRVTGSDPELVVERRRDSDWQQQYVFSLTPRELSEFGGMCEFHQTSPESGLTRRAICSLATPAGRVTLSGGRLIMTTALGREERDVTDEEEYRTLLKTWFGIDLGHGAPIRKLVGAEKLRQ